MQCYALNIKIATRKNQFDERSSGFRDFRGLTRFIKSFLFFSLLKKTERGSVRRVKIELIQELQTWRSGFKYYKRGWPIKALGYSHHISACVFVYWMYSWSFPVTPKQSKTNKQTTLSSTNNCVPIHSLFFFSFQKESLEKEEASRIEPEAVISTPGTYKSKTRPSFCILEH